MQIVRHPLTNFCGVKGWRGRKGEGREGKEREMNGSEEWGGEGGEEYLWKRFMFVSQCLMKFLSLNTGLLILFVFQSFDIWKIDWEYILV